MESQNSIKLDSEYFLQLLEKERFQLIQEELAPLAPADIADIIEGIDDEIRQKQLFDLISEADLRSETLAEVEEEDRKDLIREMSSESLARVISDMASDDAVDLLNQLDSEQLRQEVLELIDPEVRADISRLLPFDEESAGGIMTSELCAFPSNMTVATVLKALSQAELKDPVMYLYITDPETSKLLGNVALVELLAAAGTTRLKNLTEENFVWAEVDEDREVVAAKFRKYNLWAIPVLDAEGCLIGRITADDILDISIQEADEDIAKMAGTPDLISHNEHFIDIVRLRLPWLLITLLLALVNVFVIGQMLNMVDDIIVLAIMPPVIAAMGGNTGMQSATVFIRDIALERILPEDYRQVCLRETLTGVCMGLVCGLLAGVVIFLGLGILDLNMGGLKPYHVAEIIFFSITNTMTFASFFGTVIPIALKKIGFDPAVSAGPFVTTLNDILSSAIYFSTALLLLKFFH